MDFMGSKKRLVSHIEPLILGNTFLDGCCGSGVVSQHVASTGRTVTACDLLHFPGVVVRGSIGLTDQQKQLAAQFIEHTETFKGKHGFFYNNYSGERTYFLPESAAFLDQYREEVENVSDPKVKDYLLYCGLESLSRVHNVCGMQACFLKEFKRLAKYKVYARLETMYEGKADFIRRDVVEVVQNGKFDTVYLDPPYNERQYGKTYHLYETFVRNDNPEIMGKTGQRATLEEPSKFCRTREYEKTFVELVSACRGRVIISYNSEGNMKKDKFLELFNPKVIELSLPKYNSHGISATVSEYIFVIDK